MEWSEGLERPRFLYTVSLDGRRLSCRLGQNGSKSRFSCRVCFLGCGKEYVLPCSHTRLLSRGSYNSGHLVPYNVPVQALDLVTRFISNDAFGDVTIPVVFDPSVLDDESAWKATTADSFSFFWDRIVPVLSGFLLGAVLVFFWLKRNGGVVNHQYEPVQNVPGVKA